jgi:hypothetical protein
MASVPTRRPHGSRTSESAPTRRRTLVYPGSPRSRDHHPPRPARARPASYQAGGGVTKFRDRGTQSRPIEVMVAGHATRSGGAPGTEGGHGGRVTAAPRGARRPRREQHGLASLAAGLLVEVGRGAHQDGAAVLATQHAGEHVESVGSRHLLDDLPARGDAAAAGVHLVGGPDVLLGVESAAVRPEAELAQRLLERSELRGGC